LKCRTRHLKTLKLAQVTKFCPLDKVNLAGKQKMRITGGKGAKSA
jgi:hypothetical protein